MDDNNNKNLYSNTSKLAIFGVQEQQTWVQLYVVKGTTSLEVKSSELDRKLENFTSLEPRICEVLLYYL